MSRDNEERVWEMMDEIIFCMLASRDGEMIRSRPMAAHAERDKGRISFLTDVGSAKTDDVEEHRLVNLAFADPKGQKWVSVTGRARILNDRRRIADLFGTPAKAWWDSPDDPDIRLLEVEPIDAQYWDGPGKLRAYARMAMAAMSDARPDMGENEKVDMTS